MATAIASGLVLDEHGQPVAGASVYFVRAPVSMPDVALLTDAQGRFAIGVRSEGIYRIGVAAQGRSPLEQDITVAAGGSVSVVLRWGAGK